MLYVSSRIRSRIAPSALTSFVMLTGSIVRWSNQVMKQALAAIVVIAAVLPSAATFPTDDRAIVHVLSRTTFGPRPGDVDAVRKLGVQRYIDEQLRPERIADAGMNPRL